MKITELVDKKICVLGLGVEGKGSLDFILSHFPEKIIGIADQQPLENLGANLRDKLNHHPQIKPHFGETHLEHLQKYDVIIKSAGISQRALIKKAPFIGGKKIITQTDLFFSQCQGKIIGITGTKGKSTTSSLIYTILKAAGKDVHLVGNIGVSSLPYLAHHTFETIYVYELSSFQLEFLTKSPHISVFLNVFPEHLDFHGGFDAYVEAKTNVFKHQSATDFLIYNIDQKENYLHIDHSKARKIAFGLTQKTVPGILIEGHHIVEYADKQDVPINFGTTDEVALAGRFNHYNILAAISVCRTLDISPETIKKGLHTFEPLAHRLERLGEFNKIIFYNDSIATIPQATIAALETLSENGSEDVGQDAGKVVNTLILGGYNRNVDYTVLAQYLIKAPVENIILFPETGQIIRRLMITLDSGIERYTRFFETSNMQAAVKIAYEKTIPGTICLLSPASSSFGCFKNYQERGGLYKKFVQEGLS